MLISPDMIPLAVAATELAEHPATTYLRIGQGELIGEWQRGRWAITRASLDRLLAERAQDLVRTGASAA
jgi:hypothetical protein